MSIFNNKEDEQKNKKLNEFLSMQDEHKIIANEDKRLREYLDINVFNYTNNKEKIEDIFEIKNSNLRFIDQIKNFEVVPSNIPILEVNNLTKYYGNKNRPTIINATFKVYLGDIHVVVGNFGSGKTTLFNCIRGHEPYDGEVFVDAINKKNNPNINDICGYVTHEHNWDLFETAESTLFSCFQKNDITDIYSKQYMRSAFEQFQMSHLRNTQIIDLTLLEIKKLQIIIALINDPHLVIFDQPLLGLQYFEKIELLLLIAKIRGTTRSVIIFSHDLNELAEYANSITLLAKGKVFYTGLIKNLLLTQFNKYAITIQDTQTVIQILDNMKCFYSINELKNVVYANFDGQLNVLLFQRECANKNVIIKEFKPVALNIEDLYSTLLKVGTKEAINEINKLSFFTPN